MATKGKVTVTIEADGLIRGERQKVYGHPSINFQRIATAWNAYTYGWEEGREFTPHDVAMMMTMVKCVRMSEGYHRDSVVDIVGYAALGAILAGDDEL